MADIFQIMIPSIYLNKKEPAPLVSVKKKRKKTTVSLICGLSALLVTFLTISVCVSHLMTSSTASSKGAVFQVTYYNQHPKNVIQRKLDHSEVFISVKTTHKNHQTRLQNVIDTWYQVARDHTYFFTDGHDRQVEDKVNPGHLVVTSCGDSHSRQDLCCKMGAEFDAFLESNKK